MQPQNVFTLSFWATSLNSIINRKSLQCSTITSYGYCSESTNAGLFRINRFSPSPFFSPEVGLWMQLVIQTQKIAAWGNDFSLFKEIDCFRHWGKTKSLTRKLSWDSYLPKSKEKKKMAFFFYHGLQLWILGCKRRYSKRPSYPAAWAIFKNEDEIWESVLV